MKEADKQRRKKATIIEGCIYLGIAITAFCLVFFLRRLYSLTGLSDAFFIAGAIVITSLLLRIIGRSGIFDVPGYGLRRLYETFFTPKRKKYEDAVEYSTVKQERRARNKLIFIPPLIIGGTLLIAALILMFVARAGR